MNSMKDLAPSPEALEADSLTKQNEIAPQSDGDKDLRICQGIMQHWGGVLIRQISCRLNERSFASEIAHVGRENALVPSDCRFPGDFKKMMDEQRSIQGDLAPADQRDS
jgi:hypothetical protein